MIIRPNRPFAHPAEHETERPWPGYQDGEAYAYPPPGHGYAPAWEQPPRRFRGLKRLIAIALLVGGAVAIAVTTFMAVAAWQVATSREAQMLTQAAKDGARSVAVETAAAARCQREISEARAANRPAPPCATTRAKDVGTGITAGDMLDAAIKVAAD